MNVGRGSPIQLWITFNFGIPVLLLSDPSINEFNYFKLYEPYMDLIKSNNRGTGSDCVLDK